MKTLLIFLLFGSLTISAIYGQSTLVTFGFNGTLAGSLTAAAHLAPSNFAAGSVVGSTSFNGAEWYGQDGWPGATTPDPNAYFQFTVTGNPGYYLVLNSVSMTLRHSNTGTGLGSGPQSWSLRSSLDNYTTDIQAGTLTENYATVPLTLPVAFRTIPSTVTFRLYGYNQVTTSGGFNRFVIDNFTLQGSTPAGTLAIQSVSLSASPVSGGVDLSWQGMGFLAGTDFVVERSVDGVEFSAIGNVEGVAGQGAVAVGQAGGVAGQGGSYADRQVPDAAQLYYRVKAQQPDGEESWSPTVVVKAASLAGGMAIRSVIAQGGGLKMLLHLGEPGTYRVTIYSTSGQLLYRQALAEQAGDAEADIAFGAHPRGIYVVQLGGAAGNSVKEFMY
jgi:hypothetical protein